jgi:hypothetical protein
MFPITSSLSIGVSNYTINDLAKLLKLEENLSSGEKWNTYYEFYEFNESKNEILSENIIDWNNEQTTLNKHISSNKKWIENDGIMETIFSYYLYKGFDLI